MENTTRDIPFPNPLALQCLSICLPCPSKDVNVLPPKANVESPGVVAVAILFTGSIVVGKATHSHL